MDKSALRYAPSHEWLLLDGDTGTVGITRFAVDQLTDVVYVELPAVGKKFAAGEAFGVVESVKAVSDVYAPVSGEVIEVNKKVADDPALLSGDPYNAGWLIKIRVSNPAEADALKGKADYDAQCAQSH